MIEYSGGGLNPMALGFMICMGILLFVLPRRYALVPLFAAACYMTMGQVIVISGLNFSIIRILALVGWVRMLTRGECWVIRINSIDRAILWWTLSSVIVYTILWHSNEAFIYKCGSAYDAIGLYVLFRALVRNIQEMIKIFKTVAILIVPLAACMVLEKFTGRNAFAVFGGVPAVTIVRDGVLRCQGPFPHSILAGTFAAALVPLFLALWYQRGGRPLSIIGLVSSTVITLTSGSSGPVMTYACGVLAFSMWPWRLQMKAVRRGLILCLLLLQMVMSQPVWFVIAHMGVFSGSTAYYRAFLIDQTIRHFSEWWLIGTKYEQPWAPMLSDITNMYVRVAFDGGLLTLVLFFLILKCCFAQVGRGLRAKLDRTLSSQRCVWALGAALFAHAMTFLAVWYWDQNIVNWYMLLAMIATVAAPVRAIRKRAEPVPAEIETAATLQAEFT